MGLRVVTYNKDVAEKYLYSLFKFYVSGYYLDLQRAEYYAIGQDKTDNVLKQTEGAWACMDDYIRECIHEEDQPLMTKVSRIEYMRERLKKEQRYSIIVRDYSTGKERWYRYTTMRGLDEEHAAISFMDVTYEVFVRKQQERMSQAIQEELELSQVLGIYSWRILVDEKNNMRCVEWSETACKGMGIAAKPNQRASMRTMYNLIHPDQLPAFIIKLEKTVMDTTGKYVFEFDCKRETTDGNLKWYHCTGRMITLPNGKNRALVGAFRDVTDSYLVTEERQELTEVRDLMQAARWTMKFDFDGTISEIVFSDEVRRALGYENEEDFPNDMDFWKSIMYPDDIEVRDAVMAAAVADLSGSTQYDVKYRLRRKDGEYMWFRSAIRIHRDDAGIAESAVGVFVDVNDSVLLTEAEKKLRDLYEEQNAQFEEINALNTQLEENNIQLEEAAAEQEAQLDEITTLNNQLQASKTELERAFAVAREYSEAVNEVHEVLGSAPWKVEYDASGNEARVLFSAGVGHLLGFEKAEEFPNTLEYVLSRVHEADYDRMLREIYGVLKSRDKAKVNISSKYRAFCKDGNCRWYLTQGLVRRREDGSPELAYGVIMDITDIEKAENGQREALESFESIHDALGSANWQMNFGEDGQMTECIWSDRFRKMLGYQGLADFPDELNSWSDLLHPEDKEKTLSAYWAAVNDYTGKTIYSVQYRLLTKSGGYRWYGAHGSLTRYPNGKPKIFYGLFLDINEQVLAQQRQETQLEKAESGQREALLAFESIHDALGSANWQMNFGEDGQMTECIWSDRFRKMLGYKNLEDFPDELNSWSDLLHPEDKDRVMKAYWSAVNDYTGNTIYSVQYRLLTKEQGYRWYGAHGSLTRYPNGKPKIFYGLFLDINEQVLAQQRQDAQMEEITALNTELQENQAQLEESQKSAEAANRSKTSFLFNMSHDIRTPMNAIMGFRDLLEKHQEEPEKRQDYLNKIQDASTVLLSIINNVLEMARIEKGTLEIDETAWSTEQFNDTLYSVFHILMQEKGLKFTRQIEVQHHYVYCDPTKLREIFLNVLSNAYKYTNAGGSVNMHLEEIPSQREGYALYQTTITDTGIGMSEEFLPHLFEEFARENNTTDAKVEGTGLGMPIVKRLVEMLDGTIEVKSQKGVGSTFIVTLPHRIAAKTDLIEHAGVEIDPRLFKDKHILLAEDNELNAEIAMEILGEAGFIVDRAEDGAVCVEMLKKAKSGYYDVILMDIQMPNMNGYEATRAIRKLGDQSKANIKILAMTANAFEEDKREALRTGMNGHLAKPINVNELMKTLAGIIGPTML